MSVEKLKERLGTAIKELEEFIAEARSLEVKALKIKGLLDVGSVKDSALAATSSAGLAGRDVEHAIAHARTSIERVRQYMTPLV